MDAFFDGLDCRLRLSGMVADSIMMGIVNSAMEDAYKKSCSKVGRLERLNEKSRFCELAIMQLEWCLKFLQEETDNDNNIIESTHDREKLFTELLETRDRIHNRLEETELAIAEKDRELMERKESLSKLRMTLEEKDDDISSLHSALRLERVKGERAKGFVPRTKLVVRRNEHPLAFDESNNTVVQRAEKIRRKLEAEQQNLTSLVEKLHAFFLDTRKLGSGIGVDGPEASCIPKSMAEEAQRDGQELLHCHGVAQLEIELEERATDVGILKEKIDSSFEMMGSSVSSFSSMLDEQKWVWNLEQDVFNVLLRGFVRDIQHGSNVRPGNAGENCLPPILPDMTWSAVMDDITTLRNELEMLVSQKDRQCRTEGGVILRTTTYPPATSVKRDKDNSEKSASLGVKKTSLAVKKQLGSGVASRGDDDDFSDTSSKDGELGYTEGISKENPSGHSVAEIIKSHESIIQRKTREINWLKGELLGQKGCSILRNDKNNDSVKELIARVIGRLEGIIKEKDKLIAASDDHRTVPERDSNFVLNDFSGFNSTEEDQTLREIPEQSDKRFPSNLTGNKLCEETRHLKQELEDMVIRTMVVEDIYAFLFKCSMSSLYFDSTNYFVEALISEDMSRFLFSEAVKELSYEKETCRIERLLMEDMSRFLFSEAVKELSYEKETCRIERLLMEDMYCIVFSETVKDIRNTIKSSTMSSQGKGLPTDSNLSQNPAISERMDPIQEVNPLLDYYDVETLIRENICRVVFSEMVKEWNNEKETYAIEKLLLEDIHFIVFSEVVKDFKNLLDSTSARCIEEDLQCGNRPYQNSAFTEMKNQILEGESLANDYDVESLIKESTYRVLLSEMVKEWNNEKETYIIEKILMEDTYCTIFTEVLKDIRSAADLASRRSVEEYLPFDSSLSPKSGIRERMGPIQKLDSQSNHSNIEGVGVLQFNLNSESIETHSHFDLLACQLENSNEQYIQHDRLLTKKDDANLVSEETEKDSQQTTLTKMQLGELVSGLSIPPNEKNGANDLVPCTSGIIQDENYCVTTSYEGQYNGLQFVLMTITKFPQVIIDFEHMSCGKIRTHILRLENLNHQLNTVVEHGNSIKKNEVLYRKAFTRRCYDLQTAEAEVDLLGDQVDRLLGLIQKIYIELDYYSPVLQHYFGIMDILKLMRKELHGDTTFTSGE